MKDNYITATNNNKSNISSQDSLSYTGVVTIKTYDTKRKKVLKSQIIKNAGTLNLFKYLCECLIGQYTYNNRPRYLDAFDTQFQLQGSTNNLDNTTYKSSLYYRSILNNQNVVKIGKSQTTTISNGDTIVDDNYHVKYSCTILKGQWNSTKEINSFALTNSPSIDDLSKSIMAFINLPAPIKTTDLGNNQVLLIEWDMSFNNYVANSLDTL